ncbi:carbohydrate kinase [Clostridium bornimense]|uniref:Bifunctional NAD(P)H-hydrate repair enzyme n=1 Tax=Clostridium bornimense TaxID=1216932 RepID=W6S7T9_9CLOT|nr:bifunctional ADP-dependent NAD(P)H-hydrate dehydratase/NAD(P)H-hydrate epimerase [Clostridium bornimense]CDM70467.1 carbohydrate kinase [Clostridium bornimense]
MRIVTSTISRNIDTHCVEKLKLDTSILMENSALAVLKNIKNYARYTLVCGHGNNGGDGLALARHLISLNKKVDIFLIGRENSPLSLCCEMNYNILINMGVKINTINKESDIGNLEISLDNSDITIDAILGTGIKNILYEFVDSTIKVINKKSKYICSIDIPSGINSDSGKVMGSAIKANKTICLQFYKRGFLTYKCQPYLGELIVEHIGIPDTIAKLYHNNEFITDIQFVKNNIKSRNKYSFKSNFGKVAIVAGSKGFYGAAFIATESAVKTGSGLVTLISCNDVYEKFSPRITEAMTVEFSEEDRVQNILNSIDVVGFGPGMGNNNDTLEKLKTVMSLSSCPLVIDADGINVVATALKNDKNFLLNSHKNIILTPHLGEMSRLTNFDIDYIENNRIDVAKNFARKHNVTILLKGYETIITDGEITYVNPTGNSSMANGGMGDCLTGIITSLIGQGMSTLTAGICGAYLHGAIGDKLSQNMYTVTATDIIENIQSEMKKLSE